MPAHPCCPRRTTPSTMPAASATPRGSGSPPPPAGSLAAAAQTRSAPAPPGGRGERRAAGCSTASPSTVPTPTPSPSPRPAVDAVAQAATDRLRPAAGRAPPGLGAPVGGRRRGRRGGRRAAAGHPLRPVPPDGVGRRLRGGGRRRPGPDRDGLQRSRVLGRRHLRPPLPGRHPSGVGPGHARVPPATAPRRPGGGARRGPRRGPVPVGVGPHRSRRHADERAGPRPGGSCPSAPASSRSTSSPRCRGRRAATWTGPGTRSSPGAHAAGSWWRRPGTGRRGSASSRTAAPTSTGSSDPTSTTSRSTTTPSPTSWPGGTCAAPPRPSSGRRRPMTPTSTSGDAGSSSPTPCSTATTPTPGSTSSSPASSRLEPLVIAEVAPRRPIAADLLLGAERTRGAQVIKQADVLMLHHLVPDEVVAGSLEPNLRFYEPRTAHGSSLSPAIHASLLARARDFDRSPGGASHRGADGSRRPDRLDRPGPAPGHHGRPVAGPRLRIHGAPPEGRHYPADRFAATHPR